MGGADVEVEIATATRADAADLVRSLHSRGLTCSATPRRDEWVVRMRARMPLAGELLPELDEAISGWLHDRGLLSVVATVAGERRVIRSENSIGRGLVRRRAKHPVELRV
jgi:hypothetical protein